MASNETKTRGYTKDKDALEKRMRRIEGQVRGIARMIDEDRYCIDVVTQVTAVQAALDKVALELLDDHAAHCVAGAGKDDQVEMTEELMGAVKRLMRRGLIGRPGGNAKRPPLGGGSHHSLLLPSPRASPPQLCREGSVDGGIAGN